LKIIKLKKEIKKSKEKNNRLKWQQKDKFLITIIIKSIKILKNKIKSRKIANK